MKSYFTIVRLIKAGECEFYKRQLLSQNFKYKQSSNVFEKHSVRVYLVDIGCERQLEKLRGLTLDMVLPMGLPHLPDQIKERMA